ncbi:MAG: GNAT family N-acetyltransferase, partial [Burkholderiaceae bacterium]
HALSENAAMLHIARRAGATLEPAGSETEAYLRLPPATLDSRMAELVEQQVAETDFLLKRQARQFRRFLATVQEVRQGVREARAHCAP